MLEIVPFVAGRILLLDLESQPPFGRKRYWSRGSSASFYVFNNGGPVMPLKRPLAVLVPDRIRKVPRSFAWIDHRIRSGGFLERMWPEDIGLYLFLALAADRHGLSCWRLDRIERAVPYFDRDSLWDARTRLCELDLIEYVPWRRGDPDGSYQVLSVGRLQKEVSPELKEARAQVFRRCDD
jgi:hypothetical protein